ncbi:hypothetical protein [Pseudonocardia cypriaca]|nr:hypothetical protein [Pseudonocardia cypriaca]
MQSTIAVLDGKTLDEALLVPSCLWLPCSVRFGGGIPYTESAGLP